MTPRPDLNADLATLYPGTREFLAEYADRLATIKGYPVHAQEIRKVLAWADRVEAELSRLQQANPVLADLVAWADKWPSHRVYGGEDIKRVANEIDGICARAREALAGPDTPAGWFDPDRQIHYDAHGNVLNTPADSQPEDGTA